MLRSVKRLYGDKLGASDGEIGLMQDFHFDLQNWAVRYLNYGFLVTGPDALGSTGGRPRRNWSRNATGFVRS